MPIVALLTAASAVGLLVALAVRLCPRLTPAHAASATWAALVLVFGGGVLLGVLAYLVRAKSGPIAFDDGVARWANRHASPWSTHVLDGITQLGSIYTVLALSVLLGVAETIRERSAWVVALLVAAVGGEEIITPILKHVVDRTRPTFNPAAASLGPAFPSGHSATAAVFYATAALLLGRRRSRAARPLLAGVAAGIAVAVAASRVLLDVHWLTDVIGGLALGWAWFAVCGIAFGERVSLPAAQVRPDRPS